LMIGNQALQRRQAIAQTFHDAALLIAGNDDSCAAVTEKITQLLGGESGVERQRDTAGVKRAKLRNEQRHLFRREQHDAVPRLQARLLQPRRATAGQAVQVGIRIPLVAMLDGGAGRSRLKRRAQLVEKMHIYWGLITDGG